MNTSEAQISLKKVNAELSNLTPSALITLFEIDCGRIIDDTGQQGIGPDQRTFRFHNNVKLLTTKIIWRGNEYIPIPIHAEGFEINSKGTLPTPKLSLTVNEDGEIALSLFKANLRALGDLVGSKVTRIRTFAKYIDGANFFRLRGAPDGFAPDPLAELPRDIYYIDRKSNENKNSIEFELASILDVEGVKLPSRLCLSSKCPWTYRGEGCLYEYESRRNVTIHGEVATLRSSAPPVANNKDELIATITQGNIGQPSLYDPNRTYGLRDSVFIVKDGINYYFVAKVDGVSVSPPNSTYWVADQCSKLLSGCRLRYGTGTLPFGGFPAVNKLGG